MKKSFPFLYQLFSSSTAQNVYWTLLGNGIYTIFSFIFFVLITARFLGPSDYGRLSALFFFMALLSDFADFGIGPSLSRFIPPLLTKNKLGSAGIILKTALIMEIVIAAVFALISILLAPLLSVYVFSNTDPFLVQIASIGFIGITVFTFATFNLSAQLKFKEVAFLYTLLSIGRVAGGIFLIKTDQLNILTALLLICIPLFITWGVSLFIKSVSFWSAQSNMNTFKEIMHFSGFIGINKVFTALSSRLDLLMLIALSGAYASGIYSAAIRITQVYQLVCGSLMAVFAPRFSLYHSINESLSFLKKVFVITIALLSSVVLLGVFSRPFFLAFFGPEYIPSIKVFQALLIPTSLFIVQIPVNGLVLYTLKKPKFFAWAGAIQLILLFVGNLIFIPRYSAFGPVFGLTLGYAGSLIVLSGVVIYYWRKEQ